MLEGLDLTAKKKQRDWNQRFQWVEKQSRYIVAIVVYDLVDAIIQYASNETSTDVITDTAIGTGIIIVLLLILWAVRWWIAAKWCDRSISFVYYFWEIMIGSLIGYVLAYIYPSDSLSYIIMSGAIVGGVAIAAFIASHLVSCIGEKDVLDTDLRAVQSRGRWKNRHVAAQQLASYKAIQIG